MIPLRGGAGEFGIERMKKPFFCTPQNITLCKVNKIKLQKVKLFKSPSDPSLIISWDFFLEEEKNRHRTNSSHL